MFDCILFDFDGTLMDTSRGVFDSFDCVVSHYGLKVSREVYGQMIGPPLRESFCNILFLPESEIDSAMKIYREYYEKKGMFETDIYPGVKDLILNLRASGIKVVVATSKPELYAKKILDKKGLSSLFDFVAGSDIEEKARVEKSDVIEYALDSIGFSKKKGSCLMLGDRKYDIDGSHKAGILCGGVLWGFGSKEEFLEHEADFIFAYPKDIEKLLLS